MVWRKHFKMGLTICSTKSYMYYNQDRLGKNPEWNIFVWKEILREYKR